MIKTWIVICDECGREFDAMLEEFRETDYGTYFCSKCIEADY